MQTAEIKFFEIEIELNIPIIKMIMMIIIINACAYIHQNAGTRVALQSRTT